MAAEHRNIAHGGPPRADESIFGVTSSRGSRAPADALKGLLNVGSTDRTGIEAGRE